MGSSYADLFRYALALSDIRLSDGGDKLSFEAARILAQLISDGEPMPDPVQDPKLESAIEYAKKVGTYGQIDRSKQYEGRADPKALLKSDNCQWAKTRAMERKLDRYAVMIWVLTGVVVAEGGLIKWLATQLFARLVR